MKNLIRETQEISKKILKELGKLGKPKSQFQPIPIPIRKFHRADCFYTRFFCRYHHNPNVLRYDVFVRNFCSFHGFNGIHHNHPFNGYIKGKSFWKFKFFFRNFTQHSKILRQVPRNGYYSHYFSQASQNPYRAKLHSIWRRSVWNQLNLLKFGECEEKRPENKFQVSQYTRNVKNTNLRLNMSLTPKNHQITLTLAKYESSANDEDRLFANTYVPGTYLEFPVNFSLGIPQETLLTQEVMDEMIDSIKLFQSRLKTLQQDLLGLFDLGELPVKYLPEKQVIQIYFANCDRERLETLCLEKGIVGGVIYEEKPSCGESVLSSSDTHSITDNDILSSLYQSDGSVSSYDDDVLSDSLNGLDDNQIVRITNDCIVPQVVNIEPYDDFHWV
jgi:hypothetical protein